MNKPTTIVPGQVAAAGQQILQEVFASFDEIQTALLCTPDGFMIASLGVPADRNGAQMAAMAGSMMAMARAVAAEIGHSGSRRLTFETDDGTAIFHSVDSQFPCILCTVVRKGSVLGRALWAVGEADSQLTSRLHA